MERNVTVVETKADSCVRGISIHVPQEDRQGSRKPARAWFM